LIAEADLCTELFPDILQDINLEVGMDNSRKRAVANYRSRLSERGLARFEVLGLERDRDLIRSVARTLTDGGPDAERLRAAVNRAVSGASKTGGILAALRRSPLVGSEIEFSRADANERAIDL